MIRVVFVVDGNGAGATREVDARRGTVVEYLIATAEAAAQEEPVMCGIDS